MLTDFTIIIICLVFSFLASIILTKKWITVARAIGIVGKDMNKYKKNGAADFGGIMPIIAIVMSIFLYIFFKTFLLKSSTHFMEIIVISITLILAGLVGFVNDVLSLKMTKDKEMTARIVLGDKISRGVGGWTRMLLTVPIAIPLIVINAGNPFISLPFFGQIWIGLAYPLIIVTLAIVGATNGMNLLAGYNGLESWLGIVIFFGLGMMSLVTGQLWLALLAAIIIFALAGFLVFNKFPAKVFPGDSLTFGLGALVACFAVLGNMEKFALFLFIPFIIEGILKARSRFKAQNFGIPNKDNSLDPPTKETRSLTHFFLKFIKKIKPSHKAYEREVVLALVILEICLVIFGFLI